MTSDKKIIGRYMLLGCIALVFGIWIQLKGAVAMLPGEAMNRAISMVTGKKYENIKIFFDIFYILIAFIIKWQREDKEEPKWKEFVTF